MTLKEQNLLASVVNKLPSNNEIRQKIAGIGGKPENILIIASWRTGSTFLGQLIASSFKNRFYIYEPLIAKVSFVTDFKKQHVLLLFSLFKMMVKIIKLKNNQKQY